MRPGILSGCLIFCLYVAGPSTVRALDWSDAEWKKQGCPDSVEGVWRAESESALAGQEIEFRPDGTLLIVRSGRDRVLRFEGEMQSGEDRFVELKVKDDGGGYPPVIKIRPHLVSARDASCQIKLFRYESAARARQNRESSWDIYRRVN